MKKVRVTRRMLESYVRKLLLEQVKVSPAQNNFVVNPPENCFSISGKPVQDFVALLRRQTGTDFGNAFEPNAPQLAAMAPSLTGSTAPPGTRTPASA